MGNLKSASLLAAMLCLAACDGQPAAMDAGAEPCDAAAEVPAHVHEGPERIEVECEIVAALEGVTPGGEPVAAERWAARLDRQGIEPGATRVSAQACDRLRDGAQAVTSRHLLNCPSGAECAVAGIDGAQPICKAVSVDIGDGSAEVFCGNATRTPAGESGDRWSRAVFWLE